MLHAEKHLFPNSFTEVMFSLIGGAPSYWFAQISLQHQRSISFTLSNPYEVVYTDFLRAFSSCFKNLRSCHDQSTKLVSVYACYKIEGRQLMEIFLGTSSCHALVFVLLVITPLTMPHMQDS